MHITRALRSASNKLLVTLATPYESCLNAVPAKSVTLPGYEGYFTLTAGHCPLISQLKPGLATVVKENGEDKFFISGGFAFYKANILGDEGYTAQISTLEAVSLDKLDKERAAQVMNELLQESGKDKWSKAKSHLGHELCAAVIKAAPN